MEEPKKFIRCKRCNRILKNSDAQIRGYGICCYRKFLKENRKEQLSLFTIKDKER